MADLRAPTPSAAAELAVFDVQLVEKWLMDYGTQMRRQLELKLNQMRTRLMHDEEKLRYLNPRAKLKENERRLDELGAALERRMQATLEQKRHTLALLSGRLDGMSPLKKLAQGYSYVEDAGRTCADGCGHRADRRSAFHSSLPGQLKSGCDRDP